MVGRDVIFNIERDAYTPGPEVLQVRDLEVISDKGHPVVRGVSFAVHKKEILGIAGVSGNGQKELVEAITGIRPSVAGHVVIQGHDITNRSRAGNL
jgi:ABC-type uncharacterized transport system ATPase subunit